MEQAFFIISMITLFGSISLFFVELVTRGYKKLKWKLPAVLFFIYIVTYILYLLMSTSALGAFIGGIISYVV